MTQGTIPGRAGDTALATFEFRRGELRGSHLALFATRLEHRAGDFFEVMPLDRLGALRAGFERDAGRLQWGGILLFIAVLVIGSYWPLRSLVAMGFAEMNTQSQGEGPSCRLRSRRWIFASGCCRWWVPCLACAGSRGWCQHG